MNRIKKTTKGSERPKVVPLLQYFFLCVSVISYFSSVMSLFVPRVFLYVLWEDCAS